MKRLFLLVVLCLFSVGCPDYVKQAQITTANTVATTANSILPMLVEIYREVGYRAIDVTKSQEEALKGIEGVEKKWAPVWQAWKMLRIAQDAWATALEKGGDTMAAFMGLKKAYCELMRVWPDDIPASPIGVLSCGESTSK